MIGRGTFHTIRIGVKPPENIPPAYHNSNLNTLIMDILISQAIPLRVSGSMP
jgi:hypothetical protein